jgi:mannosyltransferase OCH1-like enzyme
MELWFILLIVSASILVIYLIFVCKNNYTINERLAQNITENPLQKGSDHIPKNIYQLVDDKNNMNPEFVKNIKYIKDLNPTWNHILYDDDDMIEYMKKYYPDILYIYNKINPEYGAAKADFFRYILMYREGGVYLDIKSAMKVPLDKILKPDDEYLLVHWECPCQRLRVNNEQGEYQQWHIICKPRHPYLQQVIKDVINNIENYDIEVDGTGKVSVLNITGPVQYTKSIESIRKDYKHHIYEANTYIGLVYNNLSKSHSGLFSKPHYSKLEAAVIL